MADSDDILVRQHIAQNPNSTTETLLKLGNEFPELIIANPIFDLLLIENPESDFIKVSLFRSVATPINVLKKLIRKNYFLFRNIIEKHQLDPQILDRLTDINNQLSNLTLCHSILRNPQTSAMTLEKIACSRFPKHRVVEALLVQHPNASDTIIRIVEFINGSKDTPPYIIEKLANHHNDFVRLLVAQRQSNQ